MLSPQTSAVVAALATLLVAAPGCRKDAPPAPTPPPGSRPPEAPPTEAQPDPSDALFAPDTITPLALELDAAARASLRRHRRKWTRATVRWEGQVLTKVGVRLKGDRTMRDLDEKPSFILDFERFAPGRRMAGLKRLVVNNLDDDPTAMRETLSYDLYRAAGVAAPRTRYAQVSLDGESLGLYVLVEPFDSLLLARHFDDATGNLYEGEYGCDVRPGDVWGFDLDSGTQTGREDLEQFTAQMDQPASVLFAANGPLMVDQVLHFLAVSAVVADFDGYGHSHNYYLYHQPKTKRWALMPWGADRTLYEEHELFESRGLLAEKCFTDPACRVDYVWTVQAVRQHFIDAKLLDRVTALSALLGPAIAADERSRYTTSHHAEAVKTLRRFIRNRPDEIRESTTCLVDGKEVDLDGDGHTCSDCDPHDPNVHPGAEEQCDDIDNNCSGWVDDNPACKRPQITLEGATFVLVDLPKRWPEAAEFCRAMGHTLARIDSDEQSKALWEEALDVNEERWWIGLSDRATEGQFTWEDGTPLEYTNWNRKEPDDHYCGEDCAALAKRGKGRWYDSHCGIERPFVCRAP